MHLLYYTLFIVAIANCATKGSAQRIYDGNIIDRIYKRLANISKTMESKFEHLEGIETRMDSKFKDMEKVMETKLKKIGENVDANLQRLGEIGQNTETQYSNLKGIINTKFLQLKTDMEPKFKKLEDLGLGMDAKFKHIVDSTDAKIANLKSDVLQKLVHLNDVSQKMDAKLNHLTDNEKAEFSKLETGHQQLRHFMLKLGGYEDGVVPGRNLYLKAFSEKKSWYDARKICQREGSDLVIVDDVRINNWLKGKAKYIWIAASDQETEGTWKWTDGSTVPSQYWASGEPNDLGGEDCAYVRPSGNWNDIRCSRANIATFACQIILN